MSQYLSSAYASPAVSLTQKADLEQSDTVTIDVTGGRIDYIRCNYDTRQSNATYQWILSFNHYVQDTNDTEARQALPARWQKRVAPHTYKKMPCACSAGGGRLFLSEKRLFCPKNLSCNFCRVVLTFVVKSYIL